MEKYTAIQEKAKKYLAVLDQVELFRKEWLGEKKQFIIDTCNEVLDATKVNAEIKSDKGIKGLEVISIRLGIRKSGIFQELPNNEEKVFLKDFGSLVYSQLYNGKIQVWMSYPHIEGLMEPKQPKFIEIITPFELNEGLILNHFDTFFKTLTEWEDFDDDAPPHAPIGFGLMHHKAGAGNVPHK